MQVEIQKYFIDKISQFSLKGKGAVNYAYQVETENGKKYIVKQEREEKEFESQNDLVLEAKIAQQLSSLDLSILTPKVVFLSEKPAMYGYEYIDGDLLKHVWQNLSENEKINICHNLGIFHAEIGKKFTKEMSEFLGIKVDLLSGLHPEVLAEYDCLTVDANVPVHFRELAKTAKKVFDETQDCLAFQFLHNDAHHENIIIKDKNISGIIDFGNSEYGEIAKEFSRYIRDFPDYFQYIVSAYETSSGNKLSYKRLISNAFLSGFIDIVEQFLKGGNEQIQAENIVSKYKLLLLKE